MPTSEETRGLKPVVSVSKAKAVEAAVYPILAGWGSKQSSATEMTQRAIDLVEPRSIQAGYILSQHGFNAYCETRDAGGALEAMEQALEISTLWEDENLKARTLVNTAIVEAYELQLESAISHCRQAIMLSERLDRLRSLVEAHNYLLHASLLSGKRGTTKKHIKPMIAHAEHLRNHIWMIVAYDYAVTAEIWEGNWDSARQYSDRALNVLASHVGHLATRGFLELMAGETRTGVNYIHQALEHCQNMTPQATQRWAIACEAIAASARISGDHEWFDQAELIARVVTCSADTCDYFALKGEFALGIAALQRADAVSAEKLYVALTKRKERRLKLSATMSLPRLLAHLNRLRGGASELTIELFEEAVSFAQDRGFRPELAWSCLEYGEVLLCRRTPDDRENAMALLEKASSIASRLSMKLLLSKITRVIAKTKS